MAEQAMAWDEWATAFRKVCDDNDYPDLIAQCGESCWREFYDQGYSPLDAFLEDISNG